MTLCYMEEAQSVLVVLVCTLNYLQSLDENNIFQLFHPIKDTISNILKYFHMTPYYIEEYSNHLQ